MNQIWTVLSKETRDNLRDKRTIFSSFSLALLGPIFFVGMMNFVLDQALGGAEEAVEFSVMGAEHAPGLIAHLKQQNSTIKHIENAEPETLVKTGDEKIVLVIEPDYVERFEQGLPNELALYFDSSELGAGRRDSGRVTALVEQYARTIGVLRLQLRGVNPALANPVRVRRVDTASPGARALTLLGTLPYLMFLTVFMGAFYLAIDTTAGEREHGSLEPLLTQPLTRGNLVAGKVGATAVFSALSLSLFLISMYFSLPFVPFARIGMSLEVSPQTCFAILLLMLPIVWFAAALLTVVASFSKSYKEAQTYLGIVVLIPTLPIVFVKLANIESSPWLSLVPSLGQSLVIADFLAGDPVSALNVVLCTVSSVLYAILLSWVAVRLYSREQILI